MTSLMPRKRGKLRREQQTLPPSVQKAFIAHASGANWKEAAEIGGIGTEYLREWRKHPDAADYIQSAIDSNLSESHSKLADASPKLAERLIHLALDPKVRAYAQISAIAECFKIMQQGITDRQNREEIQKIREALNSLEAGKPANVIDIESNGG